MYYCEELVMRTTDPARKRRSGAHGKIAAGGEGPYGDERQCSGTRPTNGVVQRPQHPAARAAQRLQYNVVVRLAGPEVQSAFYKRLLALGGAGERTGAADGPIYHGISEDTNVLFFCVRSQAGRAILVVLT